MRRWAILILAALAAMGMGQAMKETKAQKDARMGWWREARFGMFLHWGLYSVPAGQWGKGTGYGEWIREEAHIPVGEYEKLKDQFNPTKFNAEDFVKMARDAGMKYIVITTKHHDGFNLFDSPFTDWDVMSTPFKRDIMAEMAAACKKYGIRMCWYHSIMDWHHPDYLPRRGWEVAQRPATGADMDLYVQYLRNEVTHLLTNYGPIGAMWFDGEWESTWSDKYGKPLYDLCRKLQPNTIVNNRVSNSRGGSMDSDGNDQGVGDFSTPEQTIPATGIPGVDWETCMTMNNHWGYNSHDTDWKSTKTLIRNLVDIASKGGNYLLNIGPRADGTFPPESVERLKEIGGWMHENGEGVYGTSASVFETLPWGRSTTKRMGKNTRLYFHVFDWPKDGKLVIPGIGNEPRAAWVSGNRGMSHAERRGGDLVIPVGDMPHNPYSTLVVLEVEGAPIIFKAPKFARSADVVVSSAKIRLEVPAGLQARYTTDGSEPNAKSALYVDGITIDRTVNVRAASFQGATRVSGVVEKRFEKVAAWPATVTAQPGAIGARCEEYAGDWDEMPDWSRQTKVRSFDATTIEPVMKEHIGRRYEAVIDVPATDVYTFSVHSDDGSKLSIDGKVVVDNDGLHSPTTLSDFAPLAKGRHRIVIEWFNKGGGAALSVQWSRNGGKLVDIAPALRKS